MAGFGTIRAEVRIGKDTRNTQTGERGDCNKYLVGVEMPFCEKAPDTQNEDKL